MEEAARRLAVSERTGDPDSDIFKTVGGVVATVVEDVAGGVGKIVGFFTSLPGHLKDIGAHILNALKWPFQAAWHYIAQGWNNTIGKLNFSIPGWVPVIGGKSFGFPTLPDPGTPSLDIGGHVLTTGLALIHAGETVTPARVAPYQGGGGTTNVTINVNGGDPNAVVNALRRYMQQNGGIPIRLAHGYAP